MPIAPYDSLVGRRGIWALFIALGFLWGSSYLWIKIGLESLPPMTLIAARLTVGGLFLAAVVAATRQSLPASPACTATCWSWRS